MVCFWKWGHKWKKPTEEQEKQIRECTEIVGIFVDKIEICSKCQKVKMTARTFFKPKPFVEIMPPFPFEEADKNV
jgi:hypothetical protein